MANVKQDVSKILSNRPEGEVDAPPQESMYEGRDRAFAALGLKNEKPGDSEDAETPGAAS